MELIVNRRRLALPNAYQSPDDVYIAARRAGPPTPVKPFQPHTPFVVDGRVFVSCPSGRRVECKTDQELFFACQLVSEDHNHWLEHSPEKTLDWIDETAYMEDAA
jgi:hypothetical protein